jgi:hypothetical protein
MGQGSLLKPYPSSKLAFLFSNFDIDFQNTTDIRFIIKVFNYFIAKEINYCIVMVVIFVFDPSICCSD